MFTNNENKTLADIYTAMLEAKKQEAKADNEIEVDGESEVSDKGASTEKSDDPAADNTPSKKKKEDEESVDEASCKSKKEGLDPVGKADADIDNDGDVDDSDKYLHNRRKTIKKAMKKESFAERSEARAEALRSKLMEHVGSRSISEEEIEMFARRLGMRVADVKTLLKYPTEDQDAQTNVAESVELEESSTRDYVDNILPKALKKAGIDSKVSKKAGYTSYKCGDYEIVNDGVGIKVKENGKEVAYYSKPKLDYKKAIEKINEEVEVVAEAKFSKGDSVKIKNVKKYDALAKDDEGTVIGMTSGKVMVKVGTGQMNVDPKDLVLESVELTEGKKLRNVLSDKEFEKSMKKALADKANYKGGKVNWNFIDADVYMELSAKGYDLRHPSVNYMDRFDKLADKLDPENIKESVELEEARILSKTASKEEEKAAQQGYKDGLKRVNRNPYQATEYELKDAYTTGQMVARSKLKESAELDEAFVIPKGKAAKDYLSKRAQQRKDMNKKNDPGAAKKHLALSVLDKEKARAKAKKKGANPSEFEYAVGHKPNKMTLTQKGLDPKKARSGKKLPESVELDEGKALDPKDVEAHLVKKGVAPKDAAAAVKKGFDYANKKYGGATYSAAVKKVAEVVWSLHESVELEESVIDVSSKINGRAMMRMDAEDVVAKLTPADMKDIARNKAQFLKTCKHKEKDVIFSMVSEIQG